MHKKIPKICTGCRVSAAKIYLYHSTKRVANRHSCPEAVVHGSAHYTANVLLIISIDFANVQLSPYSLTILFKGYYLYKLQLI